MHVFVNISSKVAFILKKAMSLSLHVMWTSLLLIQPLYLHQHTYKDPSQDLVPNNLTIRYFRFLELFLTYMRIWCCLNQMYFLLLGMMDQAWIRGTSIGSWPCMEMAASMWWSKRRPRMKISELWGYHNEERRFGWNIQDQYFTNSSIA